MSTTVFCTFDQQDLADLAIGKLRESISGIYGVTYLHDGGESQGNGPDGGYSFISGWGLFSAPGYSNTGVSPSRPVNVKIVCDDNVKDRVVSKLINLHAYKIIAT